MELARKIRPTCFAAMSGESRSSSPLQASFPCQSVSCRTLSRHDFLSLHGTSNRHKHGLESALTPCLFNKSCVSNRHKLRSPKTRFLRVPPDWQVFAERL